MTVYTSDVMGAGTSANVYVVLYGSDGATEEVILAETAKKKKDSFKRGSVDQFVKEVCETVFDILGARKNRFWSCTRLSPPMFVALLNKFLYLITMALPLVVILFGFSLRRFHIIFIINAA